MPRQEVPEASPVVPDPVAPAELAEASVPVEPQASVPRSGPGNEAIVARLQPVAQGICGMGPAVSCMVTLGGRVTQEAHFQDWEKEVSPKSTTTPAAGWDICVRPAFSVLARGDSGSS